MGEPGASKSIIKALRSEKGSITVIVPIILTVILALSAFTIDMGRAYLLKHQLQSAVDAASLAAASNVKIEFATNEMGEVDLNSTLMEIVPDVADAEAEFYFDQNVSSMNLIEKGVNILDKKGETKPDMLHYSYEVEGEIPIPLAGPFLGMGPKQKVRAYAEAESEQ